MTIIKIILVFFLILGLFLFLTRRYVNPYKLIFVFGKKGSGKSTLLQKLTVRYLKRGWTVFSTECDSSRVFDPLDWSNEDRGEEVLLSNQKRYLLGVGRFKFRHRKTFKGPYFIDPTQIFDYQFPENSCILIDEASLIWDNRDFKRMDKRVIEWFRYQRHHRCRVYLFSQNFDVDAKIRSLADSMFWVEKYARVFVVAKRILRKICVVHPGPETPARIDEDLIVDGPLMALFGGREYCFIPYWARKFDSYTTDYKKKGGSEDTQD